MRLLLMVIGLLLAAPFRSGAGAPSSTAPNPSLLADIDLERPSRADGAVFVKLRLDDGEEVPLMVDTGSTETILDESIAPKLGPRIATRPSPSVANLRAGNQGVYRAPKLYAGNTELLMGPQVATVKRLFTARRPDKGILGLDCLRHYCIQLDFVAGKMRFLNPDCQNTNDLGEPFPIASDTRAAFFDADLFGQGKMRFMLDTGMSGPFDAILAAKVFERLRRQHPTTGPDFIMNFPDGRAAPGNAFPQLSLRGRTYTDLRLSQADITPRRLKGLIGMRFLARHKITLNFPKRILYLKCISSTPLAQRPGTSSSASHNNRVQATPDCASQFIVGQGSGAPDADRSASDVALCAV